MSNKNDRWSALSLKDRADLMNMYITNGISDLKEMKKHYNSFGDGGDTEQTLSGKPTLEEFIQSKVDSTRNAALEKSYTRVKGIEIPYEFGEYEKNSVQRTLEYEEPYAAKFTYGPYTKNEEDNIKTINYRLGRYYQAKKELEDNCKYGFNCIGTATDNYPKESRTDSNKDFEENFEKYGFQYVGMKNAKPGDIAKTPEHAMIYVGTDANGNPLFNYSDGGITEYNYKKDARYPAPYYGVYTYVGTPELIQQWTEEYNTNNSKKYGGKINSFSGEEDTKTTAKPLFDPQKIVDNVPAREWVTVEGDTVIPGVAGPTTALLNYFINNKRGKKAEEKINSIIKQSDNNNSQYEDALHYRNHAEALKKYLGLPYDKTVIEESQYKPTKAKNNTSKYYKFNTHNPEHLSSIVEDMLFYNRDKKHYIDPTLHEVTANRGRDSKGDYISIYDVWNYNPAVMGGSRVFDTIIDKVTGGKPFEIYDRVYLDDYYDIPEAFRGNPFIAPAIITDTNAFMETD